MQELRLKECIEILPVELLNENRVWVNRLKQTALAYGLEFGWHYLLDLTWMMSLLGPVQGKRIMDAGAGVGVIQWQLAQEGAEVLSVDRGSRAALPLRFRRKVRVAGLRSEDLQAPGAVLKDEMRRVKESSLVRRWSIQGRILARNLALMLSSRPSGTGRVLIYNQDLGNLVDIPDNSLDGIVAVSSLEHNTPQGLQAVVQELMRVLKPGAPLLATLGAAREADWWHTPSSGWCYSEASLRRLFGLPNAPSNYARYDELFGALRACAELRDNLASFYSKSDQNGMPWGVWDPQYQSVGVCKIKEAPSNG